MGRIVLIRIGLIAAIGIAMVVLFGRQAIASLKNWQVTETDDTISVLVADRYIPAFQIIQPKNIQVRRFPRAYVPIGALQTVSDLTRETGQPIYLSVVGIPQGQALTRMVLSEAGREQGLSSLLRPGKTAVSFSTERSRAAGGWIKPGDSIAVFETRDTDSSHDSRLLFESVQVLAVNSDHVGQKAKAPTKSEMDFLDISKSDTADQTFTVLLNTREASTLIQARERGPINVVLRPMGDDLPWLEK